MRAQGREADIRNVHVAPQNVGISGNAALALRVHQLVLYALHIDRRKLGMRASLRKIRRSGSKAMSNQLAERIRLNCPPHLKPSHSSSPNKPKQQVARCQFCYRNPPETSLSSR